MPKIKLYNNIAQIGLDQFTPDYEVNENMEDEDAILVRSANLMILNIMPTLKPSLVQVLVSTTLILILVLKKGLPYSILQVQIVMP